MEDGYRSSAAHGVVCRRSTAPGGVSSADERRRRRLVRRSDPAGFTFAADELDTMNSGWDVTSSVTTSCGVARSSSLRNSFLRARAREPLWIHSTYYV